MTKSQAARRRRVMDSALELASDGGFEAVQMRDVAASANVALGTVYRYFSSKERLILETYVEQIEALRERLRARPPTGETPRDRVIEVLQRACRFLQKYPEATGAMVRAVGTAQPDEAEQVRRITVAMTSIITSAIRVDEPTERDLAVARVLQLAWYSSLIGWVGGVDPADRMLSDLAQATELLLP
ncbi:MAG: TetR family transcriptional regulator [Acidimicrobiia bacterium]